MDIFIPGLIMAFREGLEAFLIIMILLKFLEKTKNEHFKKNLKAHRAGRHRCFARCQTAQAISFCLLAE